jgi:hypothetical protein
MQGREENEDLDRAEYFDHELRKLLNTLNITNDLSELTDLRSEVQRKIREETGLWLRPECTNEQVSMAIAAVKNGHPKLWKRWKKYEQDDETFHPILTNLVEIFSSLNIADGVVEMNSLIKGVRRFVLVEAGIWNIEDI